MHQSHIRSFHFAPEPTLGAESSQGWFPDSDAVEIGISPHDEQTGTVRITLAAHKGPTTIAWTRIAHGERAGPTQYASWHTAGAPAQRLCAAWNESGVIRLVYKDDQATRMELAGVTAILTAARQAERVQWADAEKWAAEGDPIFQIRMDALRQALRVLRGPGRALRNGAEADILIHGPLPLSISDVDLSGVRILNLRRVDASIRTDLAARCSPGMIETVGMRFSLNAMIHSVGLFDFMPGETLARVGFDPDIGCTWLSVNGSSGNKTVLHADPQARLHSASPAALFSRFMSA